MNDKRPSETSELWSCEEIRAAVDWFESSQLFRAPMAEFEVVAWYTRLMDQYNQQRLGILPILEEILDIDDPQRQMRAPVHVLPRAASAAEISRCCKAPIYKDDDRSICQKCRVGCKVETVKPPEPQGAPCSPESPYPGYDPGMLPPCVEKPLREARRLCLLDRQPSILRRCESELEVEVRIPPLPEEWTTESFKAWVVGIEAGEGLIYRIKETHWDVERSP